MNFADIFTSPTYAAAQIIGIIATIIALFIYTFRNRKKVLFAKLTTDVLWSINYVLLGQFTAAAINIINVGRETVFYNRVNKKWASHIFWLFFFISLTLLSSVFSAGDNFSYINLLPVFGSVISAIALWNKDPFRIRLISLIGLSLWLIYSILIKSPTNIISNVFSLTSIIYGLILDFIGFYKNKHNC